MYVESISFVGRLATNIVKEDNYSIITLAVPRTYKNEEGIYDTDFIKVILKGNIATATTEYCKKGDMIGIKARVETNQDNIVLIADKITFLSSKKNNEED